MAPLTFDGSRLVSTACSVFKHIGDKQVRRTILPPCLEEQVRRAAQWPTVTFPVAFPTTIVPHICVESDASPLLPPTTHTQLAALRDRFGREIKAEQAAESAARSKQQASSSEPPPSVPLPPPGDGGAAAPAPKLSMMKKLLARLEKGAAEVGVDLGFRQRWVWI